MPTFTLDNDGTITFHETRQSAIDSREMIFSSEKTLATAIEDLGKSTPEIWNGFAGCAPFGDLKPVKKFTDRKTGVARIWKAIQILADPENRPAPVVEEQHHPAPTEAEAETEAKAPKATREGSKKALAIEMLKRGTTREELQTAFGWLPHTTRGFLSILNRTTPIKTEIVDGVRHYSIA